MKLLRKTGSIFDSTITLLAIFAGVLTGFATLAVGFGVAIRTVGGTPQVWVIEITEFILLWVTFLCAAWLLKKDGHVVIGVLLDQISEKKRALLNIITSILSALICLVLAWYSAFLTLDHFQRGVTAATFIEPLKAPILIIIPIGSFLLFIQFLRRSYGYLESWRALRDLERGT